MPEPMDPEDQEREIDPEELPAARDEEEARPEDPVPEPPDE